MSTIAEPQAKPAQEDTEHPHVVRVDSVPMLRGTRIRVRLIAQLHRAGDSVEDILESYPHLQPAAVHDAISYFLDHRAEIEQEIAAHRIEAVVARLGGKMDERGFISFDDAPSNG
ncbi:MAG: DUF433 domain-containing protein [Anaerolineales bacterium]|nr:DUF433 domain-containing protein [Anaerolineales bacterium]